MTPLEAFGEHLGARTVELLDRYGVPGAGVALIAGGEPVWSGAYGWADADRATPMTLAAIDQVGSISKSVTAWGVMVLVERGLVGLDDPVIQHVGDWAFPDSGVAPDAVTIRQLLNHTSGLALGTIGPGYAPGGEVPSLRESLTAEVELRREPGSFEYSNVGFNLLELVIEEVTGEDFATFMHREVLAPLGMERATFTWSDDLAAEVPLGYDLNGGPVLPYVYPEKASGGLFASVDDIARFVAAGVTGSAPPGRDVLRPESVQLLHAPQADVAGIFRVVAPSYGFGHFVETLAGGETAVWHGGQGHGWMTHFHAIPGTGDGIVILTNSQRSWPFIAEILAEWGNWHGAGPVGMTNISRATTALRVALMAATLLLIWQMVRLGHGLVTGRRRFGGWPRPARLAIARVAGALTIFGTLWWAGAQDYLFVSTVFPTNTAWLAATLGAAGAVLLASAVWPARPASG